MTLDRLTPAELRVLELLVALGNRKRVARALGRSLKTIEVHMGEIRRKFGSQYAACYALGEASAGIIDQTNAQRAG